MSRPQTDRLGRKPCVPNGPCERTRASRKTNAQLNSLILIIRTPEPSPHNSNLCGVPKPDRKIRKSKAVVVFRILVTALQPKECARRARARWLGALCIRVASEESTGSRSRPLLLHRNMICSLSCEGFAFLVVSGCRLLQA